ncbi:MAG: crossover junction endodeoxyribonuclease RuvC [Treponema sp.]|nr:crossover junction endodeoxyribonuclease RuvC [Treponema sp.]
MKKRIIGIDPGLAHTGFGIIDTDGGGRNKTLVCYGIIETPAGEEHGVRLLAIYNRLLSLLMEYKPDEAAMETLYFARNVTSALSVAEAKGVVTMCLTQQAIPLFMYTPNQIKTSVTGTGSADKALVERYVKLLLDMEVEPKPDHAADALAAAITHIHTH